MCKFVGGWRVLPRQRLIATQRTLWEINPVRRSPRDQDRGGRFFILSDSNIIAFSRSELYNISALVQKNIISVVDTLAGCGKKLDQEGILTWKDV
jgi:hypothetical protein